MLPTLAIVVDTTIKLVLLWVLGYCFWRPYRTDVFRQRLFALRDELFDLAAGGRISFENPAYWRLRRTLNGGIRFGHRINVTRLFFAGLGLAGNDLASGSYEKWRKALEAVESEELRSELRRFDERMALIVSKHVISGCPLLLPVPALLTAVSVLRGAAERTGAAEILAKKLPSLHALDDEALALVARTAQH